MIETLRLVGSSEIKLSFEAAGEIIDSMLNPIISIDADWLVKAKPFLSLASYYDLKDILVAMPGFIDIVLQIESTLTPIPMSDLEALQSQTAKFEELGNYIDQLMPYIEEMAVAAVNAIDEPAEGAETLTLGGKSVKVDTIDIDITESSLYRAAAAALTVIKGRPAAQDLIIKTYNELIAELADTPPIDKDTFNITLEGLIMQCGAMEEYAYDDYTYKLRLYIFDGVLAGIACTNPMDFNQFGYIIIEDYGYSFWVNDIMYDEFQSLKDLPPSQIDPGVDNRFEIYGTLSGGANGYSGDLGLNIREYDYTFSEKFLTFSDLGVKVVFGIPMITGKFTVKMMDLYNAFIDPDYTIPYSLSSISYFMADLESTPIFKNLVFTLELNATDKEYSTVFMVADPSRNSKASLSFKGYFTNKKITPPRGRIISIDDAGTEEQQAFLNELINGIDKKFNELDDMGFDLLWLKPMIYAQLSGMGGDGISGGELDIDIGGITGNISSLLDGQVYEGFIFENSDTELLDPEILKYLTEDMLNIARNEIYARHGWVFNDIELQIYFNYQEWYIPVYDNDSIKLNEIEQANVEMIAEIEEMFKE
jgi:hypothetical protein